MPDTSDLPPTSAAGSAVPDRAGSPDVSIVVPTYGGASSLPGLVERITGTLRRRGLRFEIVIVDDASPDDTSTVLAQLAPRYPELRAIELLSNHGQQRAILCGLAHVQGQVAVTMDDDLQHPPEELPKLLDALADDHTCDVAVGSWPFDRGLARNLGSRIHALVMRRAYRSPRDFRHTSFRAIRTPVVDAMVAKEAPTPVVTALVWQSTEHVRNVAVRHDERVGGASGFRLVHGARILFANVLQSFTTPLRALGAILLALAASIFGLVVVIVRPAGWVLTVVASILLGGLALLCIGLVGEYIAMVLREMRRPSNGYSRSTACTD